MYPYALAAFSGIHISARREGESGPLAVDLPAKAVLYQVDTDEHLLVAASMRPERGLQLIFSSLLSEPWAVSYKSDMRTICITATNESVHYEFRFETSRESSRLRDYITKLRLSDQRSTFRFVTAYLKSLLHSFFDNVEGWNVEGWSAEGLDCPSALSRIRVTTQEVAHGIGGSMRSCSYEEESLEDWIVV
ncbi:hypothetical protein DENSPDRAFT_215864 [Dentipellis sp. KUC8613]|nr:hypothetical protein DENSPDRAFT_215864 [Dentipellis sp. KUC8613]